MPNVGGEWHRLLDLETPEDWGVFTQPGGLAKNAENLAFLTQTPETLKMPLDHPDRQAQGRSYYNRLVKRSPAWVKRYVHAQLGDDPDGTAVFRESFTRNFHVVPGKRLTPGIGHNGGPSIFDDYEESEGIPQPDVDVFQGGITPDQGMQLLVGQDFGRNPCAVICQLDHRGRFLVLEEIVSTGVGLQTHITNRLRPTLMQPRYLGMPVLVVGDPSGVARDNYEESCFDLLEREGFTTQSAPTNAIDPRLRAVENLLLQQVGGKAMFLLDEGRCPNLLKALMGLYRYGKMNNGQIRPVPDKTNPWSDLADALQYAALMAQPGAYTAVAKALKGALRRRGVGNSQQRKRISPRGWA
jgi:hypothetical protein